MSRQLSRQFSALSLDEDEHIKTWKGQLKLFISAGSGVLTINVLQARYIQSANDFDYRNTTFVQVLLIGKHDTCAYFDVRTRLVNNNESPEYNEIFSFELTEQITKKRLEINVWGKSSNNIIEFLGCMSFGVGRLIAGEPRSYTERVDGWFYLLEHRVGMRKHLPVPSDRLALRNKNNKFTTSTPAVTWFLA